MKFATKLLLSAVAGLGLAFNAAAVDVPFTIAGDIAYTSADNPIFLKGPTVVQDGGSLTFGPGCVVVTLEADDGGIVVARGGQIFVNGTASAPVIMTSANDVATWPGSVTTPTAAAAIGVDGVWGPNPALGNANDDLDITAVTTVGTPAGAVHRRVDSEWRNLTIMGKGLISASWFDDDGDSEPNPPGPRLDPDTGSDNPTIVDGTASARMEGLDAIGAVADSTYGAGDDDDDSGSISYLSMRYTGRVRGEGDELNGLSLGAIGRGTDISHVDIMNNVDDGIEIWGGTVNLKYVNIWNIGDDSFDIDQGWRGKAQFGLIVQGYAAAGAPSQGSGAGDNIFEHDGAEQSDVQPRTTAVINNFTAIGMTNGDGATTWRDNARVQYGNMLFIDVGEELVRFDNKDGDGALGYGYAGTHDFWLPGASNDIWEIPYSTLPTENPGLAPYTPAEIYGPQVDGFLAQITDSVIYDVDGLSDPGDFAFTVGVLDGATSAPVSSGVNANVYTTTLPIVKYDRTGTTAEIDGKTYTLVALDGLDPRPAIAAAKGSIDTAPADGFFTPAPFRGAFSPTNNWAEGWTAASNYGFFANTGANASDPAIGSITLAAKLNFPTTAGVFYTVYESADGVTYSPIATIEGDGSTMSVADVEDFDASKLYKVEAQ